MAASGSCSAGYVSGTVFFLLSAHEDVQITLQTGPILHFHQHFMSFPYHVLPIKCPWRGSNNSTDWSNTTFSPTFCVFRVPCSFY